MKGTGLDTYYTMYLTWTGDQFDVFVYAAVRLDWTS